MAGYQIARLEEIEQIDDGRAPFRAVRHHFGITTFGITASTAAAEGDRLVNEHDESEPDSSVELYLVVSGHATFELDGETRDAPAGTFVCVDPGVTRTAFAQAAGTTVLSIGAGPEGKPYSPIGWELFAPLFALFASGDYEQGADRAEALLAADPSLGAGPYYNTACFESRAGRIEQAIAHLRHAIELAPSMAQSARDDEDFGALREHPAFAEIVGG
jgi:tetratricopeptide (TPR) repeat protein